jgi:hypothetical protein
MFYGAGESIKIHARLQGQETPVDLYFVVTGPYDKNAEGELIPTLTTAFYYYGSDFTWHKVNDLMNTQAVISNFSLTHFNSFFHQGIAKNSPPFKNPGRYRFYNVATEAGSNLQDFKQETPLYTYDLHICNKENCAEIVSK